MRDNLWRSPARGAVPADHSARRHLADCHSADDRRVGIVSRTVTQHRIYLGGPHPTLAAADAHRHWHERHSRIAPGLPRLRGYVQNRPLQEWWGVFPYTTCAESWYGSREAEVESYSSAYYRDVVVVDEARFIDRDASWTSPVTRTELVRPGPRTSRRVLAFGALPEDAAACAAPGRLELLHLHRAPPGESSPVILSFWTDDAESARAAVAGVTGTACVVRPVAIVEPAWE